MDVVGNIVTIMDIATIIKGRVDEVRGFEESTKRLSYRVEILTLVVDPLKNILESTNNKGKKTKLNIQSAITGVAQAVAGLKKCLEDARDFVIKLAAKRLVEKFMKASKYGERFKEFSEELTKIHQDLQMALQTEIFIVITRKEKEKLEKPVEQSSKCFNKKRAKQEDELDQRKDMAKIMSSLEDLQKDLQESFQNLEECQSITLKEQKEGFNEALNQQYEIGIDQEEGFRKIKAGMTTMDKDQEESFQEAEKKKEQILEDLREGFNDIVNKHCEIREDQETGFKNVKNGEQRTLDELRENFRIQEDLLERVQRGQQEGFHRVGEGQQQILEGQRQGFKTVTSEHIEILKDQQEEFKYIGEVQTKFIKDQVDGQDLFEKGQQFVLKGQREELEMLKFLEDFLTDWNPILRPKMEDFAVQMSSEMNDVVSVEKVLSAYAEGYKDDLQTDANAMMETRELKEMIYQPDCLMMAKEPQRKPVDSMAPRYELDSQHLDSSVDCISISAQHEILEEDLIVPQVEDVIKKIVEVHDDQEEGFKNIEEGQQMILKGQRKGLEDVKKSQDLFRQRQQMCIKENEENQKLLLEKQQERFRKISDGQDTILEEQKDSFNYVKNLQDKLLDDQRKEFEEVEELQYQVLNEQEQGFRSLSEGQEKTLQDQAEGFAKIEEEKNNILEDQQEGFAKLTAVNDAIKMNQKDGFNNIKENQENINKGQSDMFQSYADYHQQIIAVQQEILSILTRMYLAAKSRSADPGREEQNLSVSVALESESIQKTAATEVDGASDEKDGAKLDAVSDQNQEGTAESASVSNQGQATSAEEDKIMAGFDHIQWQEEVEKFLERIAEVVPTERDVSPVEDAEPVLTALQTSQTQSIKPPETDQASEDTKKSHTDGPRCPDVSPAGDLDALLTELQTSPAQSGKPPETDQASEDTEKSHTDGPRYTGTSLSTSGPFAWMQKYTLYTEDWPHGLCYIKPHNVLAVCQGAPHFTVLLARHDCVGSRLEQIGSLSPGVTSPIWKSNPVDIACISQSDTSEEFSTALGVVCARDRFMHIFSGVFPSLIYQYSHPIEPYEVDPTCIAANGRIVVVGTRHSCGQTGALIVRNLKQMYSQSSEVIQLNFVPLDLDFSNDGQQLLVMGGELITIFQVGSWVVDGNKGRPPRGWYFRGAKFASTDEITGKTNGVLAACKSRNDGTVIQYSSGEGLFQCYQCIVELLESPSIGGLVIMGANKLIVAEEWTNRVMVCEEE